MSLRRVAVGIVLVVVSLVLARAVLAAVVSVVYTAVYTAAVLALLGAMLYAGYRLYTWGSDEQDDENALESIGSEREFGLDSSSADRSTESRVDDLQRRYAEGEISEAELERRLERELEDDEPDAIDRELRRERI